MVPQKLFKITDVIENRRCTATRTKGHPLFKIEVSIYFSTPMIFNQGSASLHSNLRIYKHSSTPHFIVNNAKQCFTTCRTVLTCIFANNFKLSSPILFYHLSDIFGIRQLNYRSVTSLASGMLQ